MAMDILVDTGVLLRLVIHTDHAHSEARTAIRVLKSRSDKLIAMTQNAAEFWNVCTRPSSAKGGYGLSIQETARKLKLIERLVEFRPDTLAAFIEWKRLLVTYSVSGVQVHDARLVAAMNVYGISHILTFNGNDFKRYSMITITDPKSFTVQPQQPSN
ncbi:MAG: type II toxin-antitoxin system VapC family toxin [Blastocatellia bacterium]